jgi:cell wall-associated NlpC family hydrolase
MTSSSRLTAFGCLLLLHAGCARRPQPPSRPPEIPAATNTFGVVCVSVASARENPGHKAELGTQALLGEVVTVLGRSGPVWCHVQCPDGYRAWLEAGSFSPAGLAEVQAWTNSPRVIVTDFEATIFSRPDAAAEPVCDAVLANTLRQVGASGDWLQVALPDGRTGYISRTSVQDLAQWKLSLDPTAANIEATARRFLGRPYLWGGRSPRGLDCSGFTQLVFALNGVALDRNSSQQALQGTPVPLDDQFQALRKGDLLFFGFDRPRRAGRPQRVTHVGIYLGNQRFIHSLGRVEIKSLDPAARAREDEPIRALICARRVLAQP